MKKLLFALLFIVIVGIVINAITSEPEPDIDIETIVALAEVVSYDELARYPDRYEGSSVHLTGQVVQKINAIQFRISITQETFGWTDPVYVELKGPAADARLLEQDIVEFWGIAKGEVAYRSVLGQKITIPQIYAYKVNVLNNNEHERNL